MQKLIEIGKHGALTQKLCLRLLIFLSVSLNSLNLPSFMAESNTSFLPISEADRRVMQQLLNEARAYPTIGARMNVISARLLGRPYITHPLIGSPTQPEQFVTRMDGFDCVTYLETVLALAAARDVESALERLRALRYAKGKISYATRLHYTTHWNRANIQLGFLQDLTQGDGTLERTKTLNLLRSLAPQTETFRYFP
jgi:hypothetical protein